MPRQGYRVRSQGCKPLDSRLVGVLVPRQRYRSIIYGTTDVARFIYMIFALFQGLTPLATNTIPLTGHLKRQTYYPVTYKYLYYMRTYCCFCCIVLLLLSCGVKREGRQASVVAVADSLSTSRIDSLCAGRRLEHTAGRHIVWEEVTFSPPDSLRRQHVRRVRRAQILDDTHTRLEDSLILERRQTADRQTTSVAASQQASHTEIRPGFPSCWLFLLAAVLAIGWLLKKR